MIRLLIAAFMFLPVAAYAQTSVPSECIDLAQRHHVPLYLETRGQVAKALLRLSILSKKDPQVVLCRTTVKARLLEWKTYKRTVGESLHDN